MEWQLRIILGVIGVIIIALVAFDGFRRSKKRKHGVNLPKMDPEQRDHEGFDYTGVGEVRVVSHDDPSLAETVRYERGIPESEQVADASDDDLHITASREDGFAANEPISTHDEADDYDDSSFDESAEPELIFSLTLVNDAEMFNGQELLSALIETGCRFGDMNIFHRFKSAQQPQQKLFSIANAFNPGVFDLDTMPNEHFKGISFFMGVPGGTEPENAYQTMVATARQIKQALGGKLMDSSRSVFTEQTFGHELERIKEYKRKKLTKA